MTDLRPHSDAKSKLKSKNPIAVAIESWLTITPPELQLKAHLQLNDLISQAPKRWVVYPPMVLLPSGSFESPSWSSIFSSLNSVHREVLWQHILQEISKKEGKGTLTHLAANAGIPLHRDDTLKESENILRTPSGLQILYGDFGPHLQNSHVPKKRDFEDAFWVSTKQNGITQIWAPRYTMFSRGNIKEKARLLSFHASSSSSEKQKTTRELATETAIDLYAGIGYFVFSYVKMGLGRVVGWELNPWSVEGLKRGAIANKWSIKIVKADEDLVFSDEKIVVLEENNEKALERLRCMGEKMGRVSHVNGGLLPSSEACWLMALGLLEEGWLHMHENVGVDDISQRRSEIQRIIQSSLRQDQRQAIVDHVELVKTFAPGVWHCVFDIYINRVS